MVCPMEFNPVIDKNKPEPVYQQIKEQLLKLIRQDNLPPGTLMPSVKLVAAASGVSLRTADQAMQALVDEGICFRRPKKGTFVSGHGLAAVKPLCGIWCTHNRNSMHQDLLISQLYQGISEERVDCEVVEHQPLAQGGVLYLGALVGIGLGSLAGHLHEVEKNTSSVQHLLYGVRAQQVVVYAVEPVRVGAAVPLRPFLGIPDGTNAAQVHSRKNIGSVLLLDKIGERQVRSVLVRDMTTHHQREGPHLGRPQQVGVRGCLRPPFHDTLMDRSQLVHVVALVRARTGVHEGEHAGDKQGRLVVRNCERTGKNGARLTVLPVAVAEEQGV